MFTRASLTRRRISRIAVLAFGVGLFVVGATITNAPSEASGGSGGLAVHGNVPQSPNLPPTATPVCGAAWRMVSAQAHPISLSAVAAASANDVWAVGGGSESLIMRWDGTVWSQIVSPNPGQTSNNLAAISVVAANNIWAAGSYKDDDVYHTLIVHWDGIQWSVVPSPNVGDEDNYLYGIAAVSANDVWAVGHYEGESRPHSTLVLHWDGAEWSVVPSPDTGLGSNFLSGVAASSANDVWAVGYYSPKGGSVERYVTLTEHWDGRLWKVVPSANVPTEYDNHLFGVAALSANNVWAVGEHGNIRTLMEHWDGSQWSVVPSPNGNIHYPNGLYSLSALSTSDIWAVGYTYNDEVRYQTLAEHWNGSEWSVVRTPSTNVRRDNYLFGVAAASTKDIWAVGRATPGDDPFRPLIERYNDPCVVC